MIYNITAATGQLGSKIVEAALKVIKPEELILTVRSPKRASQYMSQGVSVKKADYNAEIELIEAFKNTDVLIYIPSIVVPNLPRVTEFENAVVAAEKAKVKHFIYVGFCADHENNPFKMSPAFGYAHRRLASSDLEYTYIRNAMYADPLPPYMPELIKREKLIYPAEEGKISFISRSDIAKAVIKIATDKKLQGNKYTLTGNRNYSMVELASLLSEISGKTIKYNPMTVEEFAVTYDQPKGFGTTLASLYVAAAHNLLGEVTNDYKTITGEETEDLYNFIKREYRSKLND
ncbi:SDR family oxidoreductase [Clostridium estertheticum]|uniref:SDR family oxidoreductase n=1 Tax=Clostridium estertheticum TaxID=238834 RepID=UPI001C0E18DA|nr:SDR family oxidoreductase [Clostridium estertheticum]MBU3201307.1 SDR family oxidoreductase [Clostridium estertheticum]WAG66687.1 SDR family oxidoreductase [Clostridium estertheticum]